MKDNRKLDEIIETPIAIVPDPETTEPDPMEGYIFIAATVIFFGLGYLLDLLGVGKLPALGGVRQVLERLVLYGGWLGAIMLFTRWEKKKTPGLLGFKDPYPYEALEQDKMNGRTALYTLVFLGASSAVSFFANVLLGVPAAQETSKTFYPITVVTSLILAPIFEELIFRGFLQKNLRKYGDMTAIMIAALTFAIGHGSVASGIGAFLHGIIFGYLAMYYGIGWSMAAHALANLPAAISRLFPDAALNFVIGKNFYVLGVNAVIRYVEEAMLIVLLIGTLVSLAKGLENGLVPLCDDTPRMPVQFSSALKIPLYMAALMFLLTALQVVF